MAEPPPRGFSTAEFARRAAATQAMMEEDGLDCLLFTSEPEVRYFSGFHTPFWQSPTRPWFLLLPAAGKPIAVIPRIGEPLMRRTWVDDIRTWQAPSPADDGVSLLIEILHPVARRGGKLGVMKGPETALRMPLADYERLLAALPGLQIVDSTAVARRAQIVKSPAEIEKLAHIGDVASRAFAALPALAAAERSPEEIFRAFRRECLRQGADDAPYLVGGAGAGGYVDVISPPTRRPLRAGDILMLDVGAVFDGYFCDFDRNFAVGRADDLSLRAHETLWRATEAGLAAARPGALCKEVFAAMREVILEAGGDGADVGRMGHGLGTRLTEWPSLADFDETALRPGMALALEPSLGYGDGRMMVHEENIVVQNGAPRLLSERTPPRLPVIMTSGDAS